MFTEIPTGSPLVGHWDPQLYCFVSTHTENVGFSRIGDNRWITQYEALFCVLNGKGQVVTWRLTPRLSFAEVEADLRALKDRLLSQGKALKEFYIDNCCTWRKKLQTVFGDQLAVRLDIFHAVKRVSDKIPKRHPLRRECMRDWQMVFRDPSDLGEKRHCLTPTPRVLENNLDKFLQRWKEAEHDGQKVLNAAALKEVENLRVHMKKGCLSGIQPGRGTNRNENLHKDLNNIMSSSRYGVELAYALLTVIFFNHNERMAAKSEQRSEYPLEYYFHHHVSPVTHEHFGLRFNGKDGPDTTTCARTGADTFTKLQLTSSTYAQLYQRVIQTPLPDCGHAKRGFTFEDDATSQADECDTNCTSVNDDQSEHQQVSVAALKKILMQALAWFFLHKSMTAMSDTAQIRLDLIPFMLSTSGDLFNSIMFMPSDEENYKAHEERLDQLLKSWQFMRFEVPRDGNCLFYSVAYNLKMQFERGNSELEQIVTNVGINLRESLANIASALRKSVVEEWLGGHSECYQAFLSENQLISQAQEFSKDGAYSLDVGDLAIAALSNMLHTPVVLFTSRPNQPLHVQYPTYSPMLNPHPVCLAYLQFGPGHYDAVAPHSVQAETLAAASPSTNHCTCARKSTQSNACSFSLKQYTCRCPCYNSKQPCTESCKCKGCTNTFGIKPAATTTKTGQKRKRSAHESQCVPLQGKRSVKFMKAVGEPMSLGGVSRMEHLVICSIVQSLMADEWDWEQARNVQVSDVSTMYNYIVELQNILQLDIALFERNKDTIEKVLRTTKFKWDIFRQQNLVIKIKTT